MIQLAGFTTWREPKTAYRRRLRAHNYPGTGAPLEAERMLLFLWDDMTALAIRTGALSIQNFISSNLTQMYSFLVNLG